ncbi:hypothetical protein PVK06_017021 [Gossypium arboreum]|uniref:Uncharacterized protein n=1 Tax=Gossypium arboreum TaxID=29729 RepID=A0ABR0Q232_GOSAR|nr:hypothetical protein PVK06_017021 [Gossypium arboreum]
MEITFQGLSEYKESLSGKNKHRAVVVEENQNLNIVVVERERGGGSLDLKFLYCGLTLWEPGCKEKGVIMGFIKSNGRADKEVVVIGRWLSHSSFPKLVKENWIFNGTLKETIDNFTNEAKKWNSNTFSNLSKRKKETIARIKGVQWSLEEK